ncbi:hypothetical protein SLS56_000413 [Neofusicoccum ribis]|uniref:Uncharacterized protein n=1 Tax=Neofusicoccum ribis TaxID=45134 RepID=A0ABR3TEL0_9PEZI
MASKGYNYCMDTPRHLLKCGHVHISDQTHIRCARNCYAPSRITVKYYLDTDKRFPCNCDRIDAKGVPTCWPQVPPPPCEEGSTGTRRHLLGCQHLVETKNPELCATNCMKMKRYDAIRQRRMDSARGEALELRPDFSCPKCAFEEAEWQYLDLAKVIALPAFQEKYSGLSAIDTLVAIREWLGHQRAGLNAFLFQKRTCESVLALEKASDVTRQMSKMGGGKILSLFQTEPPPPKQPQDTTEPPTPIHELPGNLPDSSTKPPEASAASPKPSSTSVQSSELPQDSLSSVESSADSATSFEVATDIDKLSMAANFSTAPDHELPEWVRDPKVKEKGGRSKAEIEEWTFQMRKAQAGMKGDWAVSEQDIWCAIAQMRGARNTKVNVREGQVEVVTVNPGPARLAIPRRAPSVHSEEGGISANDYEHTIAPES